MGLQQLVDTLDKSIKKLNKINEKMKITSDKIEIQHYNQDEFEATCTFVFNDKLYEMEIVKEHLILTLFPLEISDIKRHSLLFGRGNQEDVIGDFIENFNVTGDMTKDYLISNLDTWEKV